MRVESESALFGRTSCPNSATELSPEYCPLGVAALSFVIYTLTPACALCLYICVCVCMCVKGAACVEQFNIYDANGDEKIDQDEITSSMVQLGIDMYVRTHARTHARIFFPIQLVLRFYLLFTRAILISRLPIQGPKVKQKSSCRSTMLTTVAHWISWSTLASLQSKSRAAMIAILPRLLLLLLLFFPTSPANLCSSDYTRTRTHAHSCDMRACKLYECTC